MTARMGVLVVIICSCFCGCDDGNSEAARLARLHGRPRFDGNEIVDVTITTRRGAEELIPVLHRFRRLETIAITAVPLKDNEVRVLGELTGLVKLRLNHCETTNAQLRLLASLANLQLLAINKTNISDDGLQHLSQMKNLVLLDLGVSQIKGSGVDYLKDLPNLRQLRLSNGPLDDAGVEHCTKLTRLQSLWLRKTNVTDVGLMKLIDMVAIQHIAASDLMTSEEMLRFRKLHQERKRLARERGEVLPTDFSSPFGSVEAAQEK